MKRHVLTLIGLLSRLAVHESLIADITVGPNSIVPLNEQSTSQSWTTIVGAGLLLCAVVAILIVGIKKARRGKSDKGMEASKGSTETGGR